MVFPIPGTQWPPHVVVPAAPQVHPQQIMGSPNLAKMTQMARSTPQLDGTSDSRDRERSRERPHNFPNSRDGLISQVMEGVHGVTIEEADVALQRNEWNPVRAQQHLKVRRRFLQLRLLRAAFSPPLSSSCLPSSVGAAVLAEPLLQGGLPPGPLQVPVEPAAGQPLPDPVVS